ncbi:MAG: 4Fe-4S dicluster domain-containing protein [Bacteroidetes bacterium]|nr:4Fe-4S dicluster domain-containing protein [Bacteroidota bacterium]
MKTTRVILSLLFFIGTTVLFLDIKNAFVTEVSSTVLFLQLIPALMKFIYLLGFSAIGFLVVILLTAIFGRVYCSSICPLGTLQDIFTAISKRVKKIKYKFSEPSNKVRYSILGIVSLLLIFGLSIGVLLLDPFSNFGRFVTFFLRPIVMLANNGIASSLELFDNYSVYPVEVKGFDIIASLMPFILFVIVFVLSYKYGRLYCNSVCPVGTLLGLLSKFSIFRIVIDKNSCSGCGVCARVCKSECIDSLNHYVDETRCVECFNCLGVCPSTSIEYKVSKKITGQNKPEGDANSGKRDFIKKVGLFIFVTTGLAKAQEKIKVYVDNDVPVIRTNPIAPPGSISIEHFTNQCTACHLCISACPTQVLQPSFLEYGFIGMLQPLLNNSKGFCNYECTACLDVCPAGAILPSQLANKKLIQIGKAKFIKENCVVETQGTDCGACAEHCPTKAVKMMPYVHEKYPDKNLKIPEVTEETCIGCGACEYACPSKPWKSIYVESNVVHALAKKPPEQDIEQEVSEGEDFPF